MQAARGASLSDAAEGSGTPPSALPRRVGVVMAVAAGVYALDRLSKVPAVDALSGRALRELLGGVLTLRLTRNAGAALPLRSPAWALALAPLLGRVLGNPEPPHRPVLGVADTAVVAAAGSIVLLPVLGRQVDGTRG